jgi:hypothetical protein
MNLNILDDVNNVLITLILMRQTIGKVHRVNKCSSYTQRDPKVLGPVFF